MSFLPNLKAAKFASSLFAAAGLDFEAILKAGDVNALKAAFEANTAKAVAEYDGALDQAVKANEQLSADLITAQASLKSTADALEAEKAKTSPAAIAKAAADKLAASGHPVIADPVEPTHAVKKIDDSVTGYDRVVAAFQASIDAGRTPALRKASK